MFCLLGGEGVGSGRPRKPQKAEELQELLPILKTSVKVLAAKGK